MSARHLLIEGRPACGASPRPDGSNTTSNPGLASCGDCSPAIDAACGEYDGRPICRECGGDVDDDGTEYHPACAGLPEEG